MSFIVGSGIATVIIKIGCNVVAMNSVKKRGYITCSKPNKKGNIAKIMEFA